MAIIDIKRTVSLDGAIIPEAMQGTLYGNEVLAHKFTITATQSGAPLALGGTVSGMFIREADGETIPLTGTAIDGAASVSLIANCYYKPGRFSLTIFNTQNGATTAVYACTGNVRRTETDTVIDPSGEIQASVTELLAEIATAVDSIPADYSALLATIAPTFSSSTPYYAGDYVWHSGTLYRFTADHPAGTWIGTDATAAVIGDEISELKSAIVLLMNNQEQWFDESIFKNGTVDSDGNYSDTYPSRIATYNIQHTYRGLNLVITSGFAVIYATFNSSGTKLSRSAGNTGELNIPADTYFRICIYPASGEVLGNVAPISEYVKYVKFNTVIDDRLNLLDNKTGIAIERTRNLFNKMNTDNIFTGYYLASNGKFGTSANACTVICPCEPNTTYTISKTKGQTFKVGAFTDVPKVNDTSNITPKENAAGTQITITTGATSHYIVAYIRAGTDSQSADVFINSLQIETGTIATPYINYYNAIDYIARDTPTDKIIYKSVTTDSVDFINRVDGTNFISGWTKGIYIDNGVEKENASYYASNPVFVDELHSYYWSGFYSGYYAFYDKYGNIIAAYGANTPPANPFTPPTGTQYARFTAVTDAQASDAWINTANTKPNPYKELLNINLLPGSSNDTYCDYPEKDFSIFNKCLCIGDSTTYGVFNYRDGESSTAGYTSFPNTYSYPVYLNKMSGVECTNMGEASATIDEWWAHHSSEDFSGYDVAVIALGINDKYRYGGWTQTAETALGNIVNAVKTANARITIFICTIIPIYSGTDFDEISQGIRDFVTNSADSSLFLVDLAEHSHLGESSAYDNGHPSAYGYLRMAEDIHNYVGYIMHNNKDAFRNVQFVGTEHYW